MSNCTRKLLTAQAVEEAMARHAGLVHAFIRRQGGGDIPYEEAAQAGRIGLWHAIRGYDPGRGVSFSTYAWVAICRQIRRRARELSGKVEGYVEYPVWQVVGDPAEEVERELVEELVQDLVGQLPPRLRQVITRRYGLGGEPPCKRKELGKELGVSHERVRQLEQDALAWLRHPARSWRLRQVVDKNSAADYRRALAEIADLRRRRGGRR